MKVEKREIRWLLLLGCLGLIVRVCFVFWGTPGEVLGRFDDDGTYLNISRTLSTEGVYALSCGTNQSYRAFRPPLFPFFAAAVYKIHGLDSFLALRYYLAVLSLLIPLGAWFLGRRLWSPIVGIVAFAWACFHPAFIHYAAHIQNDSFFLIFATWSMVVITLQRSLTQAAIAGFLMGVACLGRSQFLGAAMIGFLWFLWKPNSESKRWWCGIYLGTFLIVMFPWWTRNYQVFHRFVPFTTEGGYTLWVGNNPLADGGGDCPASNAPLGLDEIERDRWHYNEAFSYMVNNPKRTLSLAVSKLARLWGLVPRVGGPLVKAAAFLTYFPMFGLALMGLWIWRHRLRELTPILGLCAYYSIVHLVFPSLMRYRLPLEPLLLVLASATLVHLVHNVTKLTERTRHKAAERS